MSKKIAQELGKVDPNGQPFLNKYYWNPDMRLVSCCADTELYNESVLVLDGDGVYNDIPYIMEMNSDRLDLLTEYFGIHPIHQTNRISMIKKNIVNKNYVSHLESLISEYIKPQVIITFSESVGEALKTLFEIQFEKRLEPMGFWSGISRIKNKYFFVYCLPLTSKPDIRSVEVNRYLMSSRVFEFQTCYHLSEILRQDHSFSVPTRPLDDQATRENILRLQDLNYISISSLHRKSISDVANILSDFDEYDLIRAQHFKDYCPESIAINLSKSDYLELRKQESSKSLCHKYFNKTDLDYKLYTLKLALIRLYLYSHYAQESFDLDWKDEMQCNEFVSDNYKDALKAFNALIV